MTTITVRAYELAYATTSDRLPSTYRPVEMDIVMSDDVPWFKYSHSRQGDDDFESEIWSREPLDIRVDGASIFANFSGGYRGPAVYSVRELEMSRLTADGEETDFAAIYSGASDLTVYYVPLAGDGLPTTLAEFTYLAGDEDRAVVTPILSGPFGPSVAVPLRDIPGASITQHDFIDMRGRDADTYRATDTISTGRGRDVVYGGAGDENIRLHGGADRAHGGGGDDTIHGFGGSDVLRGGRGSDLVWGTGGRDDVRGNAGADFVYGGAGADLVMGNRGRDFLSGGGQSDVLRGGRGADTLIGERGDDVLRGGPGNDTFVFYGGNERIVDFALRGRVDSVEIAYDRLPGLDADADRASVLAYLREAAGMSDGDLVLDFGRRGSLTYEGRDIGDLNRILNERNLLLGTEAELTEYYSSFWLR